MSFLNGRCANCSAVEFALHDKQTATLFGDDIRALIARGRRRFRLPTRGCQRIGTKLLKLDWGTSWSVERRLTRLGDGSKSR